jgi:SAM-dependent methyltransferase
MPNLDSHITNENRHLKRLKENPRYASYRIDRAILKYLFVQITSQIKENANILEVGIGEGNALAEILRLTNISARNCVGTSLQPLDSHQHLIKQGVEIQTGILIDELPGEWRQQFDVTMACAVLVWANNYNKGIEELFRVTKPGGFILVYDTPDIIEDRLEAKARQDGHEVYRPDYRDRAEYLGAIIKKASKSRWSF